MPEKCHGEHDGAAIYAVQAGLSERCHGEPLQNEPFEPADSNYETVPIEATSTLCLRMLSAQPVCLTPKAIAMLSQDQVTRMLATYGAKMGACLLVAETSPNLADPDRLQVHKSCPGTPN